MVSLIANPANPEPTARIGGGAVTAFGHIRESARSVVVVLAVTAVGLALALQGWRSHAPAFDMLPYLYGTDEFLERGVILSHGNLSSYGPFFPPGTFWLMLPGRLAFTDPRLFEKLGGAILYLGTIVGVFFLARAVFGLACARVSAIVYGLSGLGLAFAGSLWPIGHPFFFVWMAYLAIEWTLRKDARYLTAAIVTWAVGMYVGMAITPAIFALPVVWLLRRPPVWSRTLVMGGAFLLVVWSPYLTFETGRDFVDIRSILLRQDILPVDAVGAWCDVTLSLTSLGTAPAQIVADATPAPARGGNESTTIVQRLVGRVSGVAYRFGSTFRESVQIPGASDLLLLVTVGSMLVLAASGPWAARLLVASLLVPWLVLAVVAEPGKPERFLWLWPLQVIVLVGFTTSVLPCWRQRRAMTSLAQLTLVLVLIANPIWSRADAWLRTGWAGPDAEEVQVADYLGNQLRAEGKDQAAIGYQTFIYPFMARDNAIDDRYKVGAEFDALLKYRYGIANTDQCAEGLSPADEYRVVQDRPQTGPDAPVQHFDVRLPASFRELGHVGSYTVFARN